MPRSWRLSKISKTNTMEMIKKKKNLIYLLILAAGFLYLLGFNGNLDITGDNAFYISMAKSVATGHGWRQICYPGNPFPATHCYFIFSLMLTPLVRLFGINIIAFKMIPFLLSIASVYLFYRLLDEMIPGKDFSIKVTAVALFAFNPWILLYSSMVMTEAPFIFLTLLGLICIKRFTGKDGILIRDVFLFSSLLFMVVFLRGWGLALMGASIFFLIYKRAYKKLIFILAGFFAILTVLFLFKPEIFDSFFRTVAAFKEDEITGVSLSLFPLFKRAGYHLLANIGSAIPDLLYYPFLVDIFPRIYPSREINPVFFYKFLVGVFSCGVIVLGFFKSDPKKLSLFGAYSVFYIGINMAAGLHPVRYLVPLLPFLLLYLMYGLRYLLFRVCVFLKRKKILLNPKKTFLFGFFFLLTLSLIADTRIIAEVKTGYVPAGVQAYLECNDWVRENTSPADIILCRKPRFTYIYAGRKGLFPPTIDCVEEYMDYIVENNIDYILVGDVGPATWHRSMSSYIEPVLKIYPERFLRVYSSKGRVKNYVYKVRK